MDGLSNPDGRTRILRNLALTVPFWICFLVQLFHHQLWRDETNAFALAAASPGLPALFHAIHYEGHPWLWYVLLWLVSRFTPSMIGMKVVEALVGTGIYVLLGLASPFRWFEKVLLFLGYFVVFEYTVMSRMYGVLMLLALAYVWRRARHPDRVLGNAALLGLLACTDLSGMMLSAALLLEYVGPSWRGARRTWRSDALAGLSGARIAGAAAIYLALLASAVLSLLPAKDISRITTAGTFTQASSVVHLVRVLIDYVVTPYVPMILKVPGQFWNGTAQGHLKYYGAALPLVLAAYWFVFRTRPRLLLMVGTTCLLTTLVGHLIYHGSVRHFGVTFLAFLCGLWLLRAAGEPVRWPAYVLLGFTVFAGLFAIRGSWHRPFSEAGTTADWIRENHLDNSLIAGVPTATTIGVTEQLNRPMYLVECGYSASYFVFTRACEGYVPADLPARLVTASALAHGQSFTLIDEEPLDPRSIAAVRGSGLTVEQVAKFVNAEVAREDFYVYRVSTLPR